MGFNSPRFLVFLFIVLVAGYRPEFDLRKQLKQLIDVPDGNVISRSLNSRCCT